MKKRVSSLFLVFILAASLSAPALAWEEPGRKYCSFDAYLEFYASCTDADTQALTAYVRDYLSNYPDFLNTFDADAWFEDNLADPIIGITKENWFFQNGPSYDENCFRAEMLNDFFTRSYRVWRETGSAAALAAQYPEEYAAFDADAWFAGYYGGAIQVSKEEYVTRCGYTEEGFRQAMFAEWAGGKGSFFNGLCVTVDGTPIQFQFYRGLDGLGGEPMVENQRILLPVRAIAETLGFAVEYLPETSSVICTKGGRAVTFVLGQAEYTVQQGDQAEVRTSDVIPYAQLGRTYVPLRALGEALGCTVTWNQAFSTAALYTQSNQ